MSLILALLPSPFLFHQTNLLIIPSVVPFFPEPFFILLYFWFQYLLWQHQDNVLLLYWLMSFISLDYEALCNFVSIIMTLYFVLIVLIRHCTLCLWLITILSPILKTKTSNSCKMKILVFILEMHNYCQTVAWINPQNNCKSLHIEPVM